MSGEDKEGCYCQVCGGIRPDKILTRRILIDGKEIGIDQLDRIIEEVKRMNLPDETEIKEELLKRAKAINYVPTRMSKEYGEALLREYKKIGGEADA